MKTPNIKIEATGDFPFTFYIEKAIPSGTEEMMSIKGVASTTNLDHDSERMSDSALHAMAEVINRDNVPLRVEHQKEDSAIIGSVFKAWVDERNQLWIEANLDKSHPGASMLYKALKSGAKLGLSVGGRVKHAVKELSEAAGKYVKTFYNVVLDEVSVTSRPANYDAWLVSKSIISEGESGEHFVDSPIYREFLFETPVLDYMQSFAKSIPDASWKKSIIKNNEEKSMTEDEKKKKDAEDAAEKAKKAADEGGKKDETDTTKSFQENMVKSMEALTSFVAKLAGKIGKGSKTDDEETTIMEDKKKSESSDKKEDETKEKSADDKKDETDTKEKAAKEDEKKEDETASTKEYHIDTMKSILKRIESLSKAMDDTETDEKKKEKSVDDKKEEETTEKSQELDKFVDAITKSLDSLNERVNKGGRRTLGISEMFVEMLRNDTVIQKEIRDMMNEPGFKKSVQFGFPVMRTKEGKMFRLTGEPIGEEVKKSQDDMKGKTFNEVYKTKFASTVSKEQ